MSPVLVQTTVQSLVTADRYPDTLRILESGNLSRYGAEAVVGQIEQYLSSVMISFCVSAFSG
jgi:hypothetical protein